MYFSRFVALETIIGIAKFAASSTEDGIPSHLEACIKTSLAFNINENAEQGSQVTKSSPEVHGTYEVIKGKKGSDFKIIGPTGSGNAAERELVIGDKIALDGEYKIEFEDGFNRKPVDFDTDNPFDGDNLSDNFSNPSADLEKESDDDSPFS